MLGDVLQIPVVQRFERSHPFRAIGPAGNNSTPAARAGLPALARDIVFPVQRHSINIPRQLLQASTRGAVLPPDLLA